jgi:hypothetical protein
VIGAGVLAAFAGIFALVRSSGSTTPPPDAAVVAIAPDAAIVLDAAIAIVVADASVDAPVVAKPQHRNDKPVTPKAEVTSLSVVPLKPHPVNVDLGSAKTNLTLASTLERAKVIARMLPNVASARLIEIRVGGADADAVDATRGGWVSYRMVIDPPATEGCHAIVRFGSTTTVHVERGSCSAESLMRLPTCSFTKAWQKMLGVRAHYPFALKYIKLAGGGAYWEAEDNFRGDEDDCR